MDPCPNCNGAMEIEDRELVCPNCGCSSEIDPVSGNLRFMLDGKLISAPEEERLAYENAKANYPEMYEEYEKTHAVN